MPQAQRLPNFTPGRPKQHRTKPSLPKILNTGKAPRRKASGHGDFRDGDSSIDENESVLFDEFEDASSATTDDALFADKHNNHAKYMPLREADGRLHRCYSRGRAPEIFYRSQRRPESRHLRFSEHLLTEPHNWDGEVDIYPENSTDKRRNRRSAIVSYPVVPPLTQLTNQRGHPGAPLSPRQTQTLSSPVRYNNANVQDDIRSDSDWERTQRERERSLGDYVHDRRQKDSQRRRWGQGVQVHATPTLPTPPAKGGADYYPPGPPREDCFDNYAQMAEPKQMREVRMPYHQQQDTYEVNDALNDWVPFRHERMNQAPMGFGQMNGERMVTHYQPHMEPPRPDDYPTYGR
ncbi:hypothetical protein RJZ56_001212 [Blastomyces dermatitidis]